MSLLWASIGPMLSSFLVVWLLFETALAAQPHAVSAPVGSGWYGYDGNWSPIDIRVGFPPQWISVFPSTASQETWVVGPGGCDQTATCRDKRGGLFNASKSITWQDLGFYELGLDPQLGFGGYGDYGLDNVDLADKITVQDQIVATINTTEYWLGMLGLGVTETNFTDQSQLSFLSSLVENNSAIPSHSYGYTAGAYYRLKGVPSSLTFGGYDMNRFEPHDLTFALAAGLNPVVSLNEITVLATPSSTSNRSTNWTSNSITLLEPADANLFTIDSSTPFLWLPESVCDRFASALGLTYDPSVELYTFGNDSAQHQVLIDWNLTFTFTIADLPSSSASVNMSLPYDAFDLQLSYPFPGYNATFSSPPLDYFPLRKAANESQYTIGRAFLQETYLIVDYERNSFSVHQAKFSSNAQSEIVLVDISRPKDSSYPGPQTESSHGPSTGAIVGIILGVFFFLLTLTLASVCYFKRRRSRQSVHVVQSSLRPDFLKKGKQWITSFSSTSSSQPLELPSEYRCPVEVPNSEHFEAPNHEVVELPSVSLAELEYTPVPAPTSPTDSACVSDNNQSDAKLLC